MPMDMRYIGWAGYDLAECDATVSGIGGYGSIQLELGWQLVAIPIDYGYWSSTTHEHVHDEVTRSKIENYVIDQIDDLYATASGVETIVEVANTYLGDNQFFWSYVVGSTPTSSPHNFQLVYDDGSHREIVGFWIKIIGPSAPYVITWGELP
jgi:hypothetical protein